MNRLNMGNVPLKCHACKAMRKQRELGFISFSPLYGVTSFFRYCKDQPNCKEVGEQHKRDNKLFS